MCNFYFSIIKLLNKLIANLQY